MVAKITLEPGQRFGKLVTVEPGPSKGKALTWVCQCDCGQKRVCRVGDLRSNQARSCGCAGRQYRADIKRKSWNSRHG